MALDEIHILIPICMRQYIYHWFRWQYLLTARYPTGWGVDYFHVGISYSIWSSSPHIRILQLLLLLKQIHIIWGCTGALQLTSAIGWSANRDLWRRFFPANKPWPMTLAPTNEAINGRAQRSKTCHRKKKVPPEPLVSKGWCKDNLVSISIRFVKSRR